MKILLISHVPPCTNYTAGIVLKQLCQMLPEGSVASFSVVSPELSDVILPDDLCIQYMQTQKPRERGVRPRRYIGKLCRLATFAREYVARTQYVPKLVEQAVSFGRDFGADRVWCLMESQTGVRMALPVAEKLGVPLFTQVFDPVNWYLLEQNVDGWTRKEVQRAFEAAVRRSVCCATASEPMAREYAKLYGVRTQTVQHGFDLSLALPPLDSMRESDVFRIGMAGQLYATESWEMLLATLDRMDWRIGGRTVVVRLMGRYMLLRANQPRNFEYLGWHSQQDVVRLLSECDLLYCPYPFRSEIDEVTRLSFPSKVPSYLSAARPILFHGPEHSSPVEFFRKTGSALLCTQNSQAAVYGELERLFVEPLRYGSLSRNTSTALRQHFGLDVMRRNFAAFLGIDEQLLRATKTN